MKKHFLYISIVALCAVLGVDQPVTAQKRFATPEEAVQALVEAIKQDDTAKLVELFGPDIKAILDTGETAYDKDNRALFLAAYERAHNLEKFGDAYIILEVGKLEWQFPIPLVKEEESWRFDLEAGKEEMQNRRIGRNELSTMKALLAYVDAQREYNSENINKDKLNTYAQKFMSTEGQRDGLYYPVKEGEKPSPLGELFANAQAKGQLKEQAQGGPRPYFGYYYRILTSQGPDAPGGAYDYLVDGKLFGGHAAIAWPVSYGESGIMTFIVNHKGTVYEKDLGANTSELAAEITTFNPDKTWKRAIADEE